MADGGKVIIKIDGDDSGFKKVASGIGKFGATALKGVAVGAAAVTTAVAGISAAFVSGAKNAADYGDRVDKMSQKIGLSREAFQQWDFVLSQNGASIDGLQMGIKTLSTQAQKGSDAFNKLGLSQEFVKSASPEDLFEATIGKLQEMGEGTERTALATQLLGRSATELAPLLNQSAEATEELKQKAIDYGMVMSDEAVNASVAFTDSLDLLEKTATGLKNKLMAEFLPSITKVTDGLALLFTGDMSGLDKINSGITEFINKISSVLPKIVEIGGSIVMSLGKAIVENLPQLINSAIKIINQLVTSLIDNLPAIINSALQIILALANGIAESLPELIPSIVETVITIVETLIDNIDMLIDAAIAIILALAEGLINALPILIEKVPEIVIKIVEALVRNAPKLLEAALQLIIMLGKGLIQAIPVLLKNIPQIIKAVYDSFISGFQVIDSVGKHIVEGIWSGITKTKDWLLNKIKSFAKTITQGIKDFFGIKSPSRVMRDEVGQMIARGLAIGIERYSSEVEKAMANMNETMLKSEKYYIAESERLQREKEERELREKIANAKDKAELDKIYAEEEKKKQEKANEAYLKELKDVADKEKKIYEARQKDIENAQKAIRDTITELAENAFDKIEEVEKLQADMESKLKNYGTLYYEVEPEQRATIDFKNLADLRSQKIALANYKNILEKLKARDILPQEFFDVLAKMKTEEGTKLAKQLLYKSDELLQKYVETWEEARGYKEDIDDIFAKPKEEKQFVVADLDAQTQALQDFAQALLDVKARGNVPREFFDVLRNESIEEGTKFANALLKMDDETFSKYIDSWKRNQESSNQLAKILYADEAEEVKEEIESSFEEFNVDFEKQGIENAMNWGLGFIVQIKKMIPQIQDAINSTFGNIINTTPQVNYASVLSQGNGPINPNTPINVNAVMEVDGRTFGSVAFKAFNDEARRLGVLSPMTTKIIN